MPDGTSFHDATQTLRTADELVAAGLVARAQRDQAARVETRYAIAVSPAMQALIAERADRAPVHPGRA
jgi:lysine 2,3-aminomutase